MNKEVNSWSKVVGLKAQRKLKASRSNQSVWFGLGMMGLVGWSIVLPTLFGTALGVWLDRNSHRQISWTLTLLMLGLLLGCLNAWRWVLSQSHEMDEDESDE